MSSHGHEWTPHEREGWSVCSRCGMVRNYDREMTTCSGALPKIRQRSEIEDCGQDGVCALSPGCNRHWEERNRELVRENDVLRSNSDHLSSENASLARQVESMAMRIESLAEELAKPEDVRLREVLDALDGRAVIFDGLGARVGHLLDEMDEWIGRAGEAERLAEERLAHANQLQADIEAEIQGRLARDAEIARLTAALRTETTMKEQLQDQLEERRLAYRAEWERAEGLTAELAGARRAATASIVSVNADRDRLTAELAEARAAVESFQRGSGCIDGYTIGEALAKIGASLDRTPTEGIPDAIARLKRAAETARREGARDERRGAIAELTILRNGSDPRADEQ